MKKIEFLILFLILTIYVNANTFQNCYKYAKSTADNISCLDKEYSYYDGKLNTVYKKIQGYFINYPNERQYLKETQRAWIVYRDKKCKFEGYPMRGGTGEFPIVYGCKVKETKRRLKELEDIFKELNTMKM